jgi:hypothetical protein
MDRDNFEWSGDDFPSIMDEFEPIFTRGDTTPHLGTLPLGSSMFDPETYIVLQTDGMADIHLPGGTIHDVPVSIPDNVRQMILDQHIHRAVTHEYTITTGTMTSDDEGWVHIPSDDLSGSELEEEFVETADDIWHDDEEPQRLWELEIDNTWYHGDAIFQLVRPRIRKMHRQRVKRIRAP